MCFLCSVWGSGYITFSSPTLTPLGIGCPVPRIPAEANPLADHVSATRILCGALVFPTIATIVGKLMFSSVNSNLQRTILVRFSIVCFMNNYNTAIWSVVGGGRKSRKLHKLIWNLSCIWLRERVFFKVAYLGSRQATRVWETLSLWLKLVSILDKAETCSWYCTRQILAVIKGDNEDEGPASSKNNLCMGRLGFILSTFSY